MKLIRAVELPGRGLYEFGAWLDETLTIQGEDGERPDPAWVAHRVWQIEPHPDQTDEEYQVVVVMRLAAEEWLPEWKRRRAEEAAAQEQDADAPVALALEGMALDLA